MKVKEGNLMFNTICSLAKEGNPDAITYLKDKLSLKVWTKEQINGLNIFRRFNMNEQKEERNVTYPEDTFITMKIGVNEDEVSAKLNWIEQMEGCYYQGGVTYKTGVFDGGSGVWMFMLKEGELIPLFDTSTSP